jgi:hypothetical protein
MAAKPPTAPPMSKRSAPRLEVAVPTALLSSSKFWLVMNLDLTIKEA